MVTMAATTLFAFAVLTFPGSALGRDNVPHAVAVATARATIVTGVRITPDTILNDPRLRIRPEQRPREIPCPERRDTPCRLIIVDMP